MKTGVRHFRWKRHQEKGRGGVPEPVLGEERHQSGGLRKGKVVGTRLGE